MRGSMVKPILALTACLLVLSWASRLRASEIVPQVTLQWTAPADPTIAGYYLVWGTNSGTYTSTLTNPATLTSAQVTGLLPNQVYYFNVADFNSNGTESAYAGEIVLTNEPSNNGSPTTTNLSVFVAVTNGPPSPSGTNGTTISGNGGGGTVVNSTSTAGSNASANFWGVPPRLTIVLSNGQPTMNIEGTVGAMLFIQTSTNILSPDSWQTLTNISMTNVASLDAGSQSSQPEDALDLVFVPAAEELPISRTNSTPSRVEYYRAMMPYDYVVFADNVLAAQGYRPRMVIVNMPGIISDDTCYLSEGSSFIHYDRSSYVLQLEGSGPTIRAIATTLATSLGLDWTSASEFTYSNGVAQIVATVVQTEPASSDPVPGKTPPKPSSAIDF